jgi:hypothetical protein
MARKDPLKIKNQTTQTKDAALQSKTDRLDRIMNSIVNTSIILMSTMILRVKGRFYKVLKLKKGTTLYQSSLLLISSPFMFSSISR